jgi:hypothetical protein
MVTRIWNEQALGELQIVRPKASFTPVTGIAGVKEISVVTPQSRKLRGGPIVIDTEMILPLDAVRHPAINALPAEFGTEKRLETPVVGEWRRGLVANVPVGWIGERVHGEPLSPCF